MPTKIVVTNLSLELLFTHKLIVLFLSFRPDRCFATSFDVTEKMPYHKSIAKGKGDAKYAI